MRLEELEIHCNQIQILTYFCRSCWNASNLEKKVEILNWCNSKLRPGRWVGVTGATHGGKQPQNSHRGNSVVPTLGGRRPPPHWGGVGIGQHSYFYSTSQTRWVGRPAGMRLWGLFFEEHPLQLTSALSSCPILTTTHSLVGCHQW